MRRWHGLAVGLGAALWCASFAGAAPVTVTFTGTVIQADDPDGISDGSVVNGTAVSGSLTFDRATAPADSFPNSADFHLTTPPASLSLHAGSYSLVGSGLDIALADFAPADAPYTDIFQALSTQLNPAGVLGPAASAQFGIVLVDNSRTALGSLSLADVPFVLSLWDDPELALTFESASGEFSTVIHIDSLSALPEPNVIALALLACAALVFRSTVSRV